MKTKPTIGIVGLWHLGCVAAAAWLKLGHQVIACDFDLRLIDSLSQGKAPLYEPDLDASLLSGLEKKQITFSLDPSSLKACEFIFMTYDTPVNEQDLYDLHILEEALEKISPHLSSEAVLIISSQVPVGTCKKWQNKLKNPIVYSPENLKLGEAIANYLRPGHIVFGCNKEKALLRVRDLFSSIPATYITMDLNSAEMTKHAINAFLASSITFANQLSDACGLSGAHFKQVTQAMKHDPRIGNKAYIKAGVGFSGGTLGRDLRILSQINTSRGGGTFPFFQEIWQHNRQRPKLLVYKMGRILGQFPQKTISFLGVTYKPGTSTLRRSIPLEMARDFTRKGAKVKIFDPKADWSEIEPIEGIIKVQNPYDLGKDADFLLVLTEWPEFKHLDFQLLGEHMISKRLFDPYGYFSDDYETIQASGFTIFNHLM